MTKRVLVAEDDAFLTRMYKMNLEDAGFKPEIVHDGKAAIASMDESQPDLMVLDLLMPDTDGFTVLEHYSKKKYSFPVLVLTNLSQDVDKNRCLELGAKDFFVKSDVDIDDFVAKVQEMLA